MAVFSSYYKILSAKDKKNHDYSLVTDAVNMNHAGPGIASISWYSQIMKGAGSRLQRYQQSDAMDIDVDVSRCLDIIAEEISNDDDTTNLPFLIEYQVEDNEEIADSTIVTLRAALRQWGRIQDLNNRIFRIARVMVKYGDCFFQKSKDTKKWEYIDPSKVMGIEIDEDGKKIAYHLRGTGGTSIYKTSAAQIEIVAAEAIVHFTLSDDMGDAAPFGDSLLQPIYRTFRQLQALEDSVVIYRLVRAPERRVYYIDVGNMPQQRVKQYLETVKNEIRQKRMPNTSTQGGEVVDGTYNANSLGEDIFLAQTAGGRGSRVETLPGGENLGELTELTYFRNKMHQGLRVPTSYLKGADEQGSQYSDGKVGIAYVEELRFANFIRRQQNKLEIRFDEEFKNYLNAIGITIDPYIFLLRLPEPQSFGVYRQAALDAELVNGYNSIKDEKVLSTRFKLKRYLGLTDDEVQMNELMLKDELGIDENANISALRQIYDPIQLEGRSAVKVKPKVAEKAEGSGAPAEGGNEPDLGMGGLDGGDEGGLPDMGGGDEGGMPDLGGL